jgi:hypothetical protein
MKLTHRAGMLLGAAALTAAMTGPALAAPALAQSPGNTIHSGYVTLAMTFIPAPKDINPPSWRSPAPKPIIPPS